MLRPIFQCSFSLHSCAFSKLISSFIFAVEPIGRNLPIVYVEKLLNFLADRLESSCHLHFYLLWCRCLLFAHGTFLKLHSSQLMSQMTHLQKAIARKMDDITKV